MCSLGVVSFSIRPVKTLLNLKLISAAQSMQESWFGALRRQTKGLEEDKQEETDAHFNSDRIIELQPRFEFWFDCLPTQAHTHTHNAHSRY